MEQLQKRLGYTFSDASYLETALTHSSYANEQPGRGQSNERLEFLGDAVLGFCAAKTICRLYPDMPEGGLTRLRAELVCEASLHQVALALELGSFIRLGKNEECNGGRERTSILADCVEAIIAAIYLDGGLSERIIKPSCKSFCSAPAATRRYTPSSVKLAPTMTSASPPALPFTMAPAPRARAKAKKRPNRRRPKPLWKGSRTDGKKSDHTNICPPFGLPA